MDSFLAIADELKLRGSLKSKKKKKHIASSMIGTNKLKNETGKSEQPKMLRNIEEARTSESTKASASAHIRAAVQRFVGKSWPKI